MNLRVGNRGMLAIATATIWFTTCASQAVELSELVGKWNNDATGENITFEKNYDIQDSRLGQGRAVATIEYAANYVIAYNGGTYCWFYITLTNEGNRMNLAVRNPNQSDTKCLKGVFNKTTN
ncbi:MAG: hypothetical protein M3Z96_00460 [Pseudomonadota bacterium]|nr:hypothetical protein [Pseudomonadota bacterium]MDQ6867238.1 hypothetical protein [Pseudomonadota bacterium]